MSDEPLARGREPIERVRARLDAERPVKTGSTKPKRRVTAT